MNYYRHLTVNRLREMPDFAIITSKAGYDWKVYEIWEQFESGYDNDEQRNKWLRDNFPEL